MFVLTLKTPKKGKIKTVLLIPLCLIIAFSVCFALVSFDEKPQDKVIIKDKEYSLFAKSEEERAEFLSSFGLIVDELLSEKEITVPDEFSPLFEEYNALQKLQGLDLEKFKGETAIQYIYSLSNCDIEGEKAYADIIVYGGRVIAGHLTNYLQNGNMYTFIKEQL